jgi:HlyD family secretion protein
MRQQALDAQAQSIASELRNLSGLVEKGYYPRNKLLAQEREHTRLAGEAGLTRQEIARMQESIEEARLQMRQTRQAYVEAASQQLADARIRLNDLREKLSVAEDMLTRVEVRAPVRGIIQAIKVSGAGSVVRPGETLAEIIPVDDELVLSARVSPIDIHNVHAGQKAEVRFAAFVKEAPAMWGKVASLSADSLVDEITKQPYYKARIVIDPGSVPRQIASVLVPGMPADVIINTGERTLLQYLLNPLGNRLAKSMREK